MRIAICDDYMEHARDIEEKITSVNEGILTDLYDDIEQLFVEVNADKKNMMQYSWIWNGRIIPEVVWIMSRC